MQCVSSRMREVSDLVLLEVEFHGVLQGAKIDFVLLLGGFLVDLHVLRQPLCVLLEGTTKI